ncbi:MAG: hypothetical protein ABI868_18355 [Acidobacteriota bacterium]
MNSVDAGRQPLAVRAQQYAAAIAVVFLALHLPFLPHSLEDLDSINFALGLRDFDVARHQPHPPGYPVYIAIGKAVHAIVPDEGRALAVVSVGGGTLGLFALIALFARIDRQLADRWSVTAALVTVTSPLYWFTSVRPLSDMPGLAVATAVQAYTLSATGPPQILIASVLAGLACGLRSQAAWLTVPLLAFVALRRPAAGRVRLGAGLLAGFGVGCAIWVVPLVVLSGGPAAYWHALFDQGAEDLTGIQMLWTTPTVRQLALSLYYAFVAPWAMWPIAATVLVFAVGGLFAMVRDARRSLAVLTAAFGPYLFFDILFQETVTTRYALPLVAPVAYLAIRGAAALPRVAGIKRDLAMTSIVGAAAATAVVAVLSVFGYAFVDAPAFRMVGDMRALAAIPTQPPRRQVLAMHRRENLDLRRTLQWVGADQPAFARRLPAPPKHEWLELVKYWNGGGTDPVWFVADPMRTDLALIDRSASRVRPYVWPLRYPVLIGGVRPGDMQWHVFDSPGWYLGEGWALTPETAGVAAEDHHGPGLMPIEGWIRRRPDPLTLMIGGRNLVPDGPSIRAAVAIDGRPVDDVVVAPGAFLRFQQLPPGALDGAGRYARISVAADSPRLAIEQFDAQSPGLLMFGFGDGWYELEFNPATGRTWRWMSERGEIRVRGAATALRLVLAGETDPLPRSSRMIVRVGDRVVGEFTVGRTFFAQTVIPKDLLTGGENVISVETDQVVVPADRSQRSQDRRHLGLRLFDVQLMPAS